MKYNNLTTLVYSRTPVEVINSFTISGREFWVNNDPFLNCQIYSIGCTNNIICNSDNAEKVFIEIGTKINGKNMVMIDVDSYYENTVEKMFNGYINIKTPYVSTSGSFMTIYLIKIQEWITKKKESIT